MKKLRKVSIASFGTLIGWAIANIASAQTTATTTPGVPDTGAGGDVMINVLLLATSAAIALIGLAYLSRRWAKA